jgi:hypothetical protein
LLRSSRSRSISSSVAPPAAVPRPLPWLLRAVLSPAVAAMLLVLVLVHGCCCLCGEWAADVA